MSPVNSKRTTNRAIVSLGSNIEPRAEYLRKAIAALSALPETTFEKASSIIETEPVGVPPEFAALKFLNQATIFVAFEGQTGTNGAVSPRHWASPASTSSRRHH